MSFIWKIQWSGSSVDFQVCISIWTIRITNHLKTPISPTPTTKGCWHPLIYSFGKILVILRKPKSMVKYPRIWVNMILPVYFDSTWAFTGHTATHAYQSSSLWIWASGHQKIICQGIPSLSENGKCHRKVSCFQKYHIRESRDKEEEKGLG